MRYSRDPATAMRITVLALVLFWSVSGSSWNLNRSENTSMPFDARNRDESLSERSK
jgi:hypothetical protein